MAQALRVPSPADEPHVPGEAFSAWRNVGGDTVLASEQRVVGIGTTPVQRKAGNSGNDLWPSQKPGFDSADQPICVELVRTSSDDWRVVVDGLRCPFVVPTAVEVECALPPPFDPMVPITPLTVPRRLLVGVRLENEALRPADVQLVVEQIVYSDERRDQAPANLEESIDVSTHEIKPYAVGDPSAKTISVGYPFRAPAQSALGIVSKREVELWQERAVQHEIIKRTRKGTIRSALRNVFGAGSAKAPGPPPAPLTVSATPPQSTRTHVVGGMRKSALVRTTEILDSFTRICEDLMKLERDRSIVDPFETRLEKMRELLVGYDMATELAMLDTLARSTSNSSRITTAKNAVDTARAAGVTINAGVEGEGGVAERIDVAPASVDEYESDVGAGDGEAHAVVVDIDDGGDAHESLALLHDRAGDTGAVPTSAEIDALRQRARNAVEDPAGEQPPGSDMYFVYDRMGFEERTRTNLRLEYRLEITELDDTKRIVRLAPERWLFGYAAHAGYSKQLTERDDFMTALQRFRSCLQNREGQRATVRRFLDPNAWAIGRMTFLSDQFNTANILTGLDELEYMLTNLVLPPWPALDLLDTGANAPKVQRDVGNVVRVLPQILDTKVVAAKTTKPIDTDAPDQWARSKTASASTWAVILSYAAGYSVIGAVASTGMLSTIFTGFLASFATFSPFPVVTAAFGALATLPAAIAAGYGTSRLIVGLSRVANQAYESNRAEYRKARKLVKGTPVLSCYANATETSNMIRDALKVVDLSAIAGTGTRVRFHQIYSALQPVDGHPVVEYDQWDAVPNTNALRLLPPSDVAEQLFEATELRRLPLVPLVRETVGTADSGDTNTPSELAAVAAHTELVALLWTDRQPLRGDHLMASVPELALAAAVAGAELVRTAYGSKAGVTHVDGDDECWRCMRHSTAARLALRHLAAFDGAERKMRAAGANAASRMGQAHLSWTATRRNLVDRFAKAWLVEARRAAKEFKRADYPMGPVLDTQTVNAVGAFARLCALTDNSVVSLAALSSAIVASKWVFDSKAGDTVPVARARAIVARAEIGARTFAEQATWLVPDPEHLLLRESMASRRIDVELFREWTPSTNGGDVHELTDRMSGLSTAADRTLKHYYFPMGASLTHTPGRVAFNVRAMNAWMVWLEPLMEALERVMPSIIVQDANAPNSGALRIEHGANAKGIHRHPLVISLNGQETVSIFYAQVSPAVAMLAMGDQVSSSVNTAVERVTSPTTGFDGSILRRKIAAARTLAFNVDRLCNALALVRSMAVPPTSIDVDLDGRGGGAALATAVALSLLATTSGSMGVTPALVVSDALQKTAAITSLERAREATKRAMGKGCRAVPLMELCLAVV